MLRVLIFIAVVGAVVAISIRPLLAEPTPTTSMPDVDQTLQAARSAADAVHQADQLQRQTHFRSALESQRQLVQSPPQTSQIEMPNIVQRTGDITGEPQAITAGTTKDMPSALLLVSLSMPMGELKELARQAAKIGIPLVFRGLKDDSFPAMQKALAAFGDVEGTSFLIDPTAFRRFKVDAVPTFILPLAPLEACDQQGCPPVDHVKVTGDAGLMTWLERIERHSSRSLARDRATALLQQLEAAP